MSTQKQYNNQCVVQEVLTAFSYFKGQYVSEQNAQKDGLDIPEDEIKILKDSYLSLFPQSQSVLKVHFDSGKYLQIIFKECHGIIKMTETNRDSKLKRAVVVREEDLQLVSNFTYEKDGSYEGAIHAPVTPWVYEFIGGYH